MRKLIQFDTALLLAILTGLTLYYAGPLNPVDTFQYDLALAQNAALRGNDASRRSTNVAVIAVDEESLDKFGDLPRVFLAPKWAALIETLAAADAAAIGFDIVFAYPDQHFVPGWERDFLAALQKHQSRIVLGRSERTVPSMRFQAALGFDVSGASFGAVEVRSDADNVHRSVDAEIAIRSDSGKEAGLSTLASRLLKKAGHDAMPASVRLAPRQRLETVPTYPLWTVLKCGSSDAAAIRKALGSRIILVGTTLAGEDRKWSPDRFMPRGATPGPEKRGDHTCLAERKIPQHDRSRLVPSIYLHAAAIDSVLSKSVLRLSPDWMVALIGACLVFAVAWGGFHLAPAWMFALLLAAGFTLHLIASATLAFDSWHPTATTWIALLLSAMIAHLVRILLVERRARLVRSAFNHYLTEDLVERIVTADKKPTTGGERREITVMFADLSGFTALSEQVSPEALMDLTNDYLGRIVEQVHATGGYVDKFIGDAVMAIWGAPADDPDHAVNAMVTAQRIIEEIDRHQSEAEQSGAPGFSVRVALNSGPAIVGNVGAQNRLNYSAVGRTVNIAARIEGLLSTHGAAILCGEETARRIGDRIALKQVGDAQLKGIAQSVKLFAPRDAGPVT